jgi:hypothetical protein
MFTVMALDPQPRADGRPGRSTLRAPIGRLVRAAQPATDKLTKRYPA